MSRTPPKPSQEMLFLVGGFSIGVLAQLFALPELALGASLLSVAALAILAGMRIVARATRTEARRFETTRAAHDLETRLDRHVSRIPRPHIRRRIRPAMDRQYLPVVTSDARDQ